MEQGKDEVPAGAEPTFDHHIVRHLPFMSGWSGSARSRTSSRPSEERCCGVPNGKEIESKAKIMCCVSFVISVLLLLIAHGPAAAATTPQEASLMALIRLQGPLSFCGEAVPTEEQEVRERYEKELLLALGNPAQVILWLKRSSRYLPLIEQALRDRQMPDDLKYMAFAESAMLPHAGSAKGAVGYWQFIPSTGRKYGLTINNRIDERRNVFASTEAAIRYLRELHEIFGSWSLAAAAYNMGEERLMAEILEQGTRNYYHLHLPLETQRFLFRILSVKVILSEPEKYGYRFSKEDTYPPVAFDPIQVKVAQETPIRIIAQAAGTHFKAIKDLNPEIRGHYLPAGTYRLLAPRGSAAGFQGRFDKVLAEYLSTRKGSVYIVRAGDNLSMIAERFGVPLLALVLWNGLDPTRPIHPGDRLIIYPGGDSQGETEIDQGEKDALPSKE